MFGGVIDRDVKDDLESRFCDDLYSFDVTRHVDLCATDGLLREGNEQGPRRQGMGLGFEGSCLGGRDQLMEPRVWVHNTSPLLLSLGAIPCCGRYLLEVKPAEAATGGGARKPKRKVRREGRDGASTVGDEDTVDGDEEEGEEEADVEAAWAGASDAFDDAAYVLLY
jgi:hypothetical protein